MDAPYFFECSRSLWCSSACLCMCFIRGNCSFREKAYSVAATGAAAMIVVNTEDTLLHMAASLGTTTDEDSYDWGPEGLSCLMVSHRHSISLKWAIKQGLARASLVPFVCGRHESAKANCVPALEDECEWGQQVYTECNSCRHACCFSYI